MDISEGIIDKWKDTGEIRDMSEYERMKGRIRGMQIKGERERGGRKGPQTGWGSARKAVFSLTGRSESAKNNLFSCHTAGKRGTEHSATETAEENRMRE